MRKWRFVFCCMLGAFWACPSYAQLDLSLPQSARHQAFSEADASPPVQAVMVSTFSPHTDEKEEFNSFVKDHAGRVLRNVFGKDADIYTGTASFLSRDINGAMGTPSARLVGVSETLGKIQVGGGYSWGEKNPAYMGERDGLVFGMGTSGQTWRAQASYMMGRKKVLGMKLGREKYDSVALGVSLDAEPDGYGKMPYWHGMTGALQWRSHENQNKSDDLMITVGKRWKF